MKSFMSASALAALAFGTAAVAQHTAPPAPPAPTMVPSPPVSPPPPPAAPVDVHTLRPAFVPLVAAPLDMAQASDPIWTAGERPAKNVIARLTLRPFETAIVDQDAGQGAGKKLVLLRAYSGDQTFFHTSDELAGTGPRRLYCADGEAVGERLRILCFEDREGDGLFESKAYGLGESGAKAEQLSIVGKSEPLPAPIRYRAAAAGEAPEYRAVFTNCARDHDRPRYSFGVEGGGRANFDALLQAMVENPNGGGSPEAQQRMSELAAALNSNSSGNCRISEKVREGEALYPAGLPEGNAVARLGELVIQVAPKEQGAAVRLLGLREPQRLYRMTYGTIPALEDSVTDKQRRLAISQKFDRPVIVTAGEAKVNEGRHEAGDVILEAGFRHGYMGVLTQDTVIRTLLSKRSLPQGTVLYGMPMSSQRVLTRYGMPVGGPVRAVPEADDVHLIWCVPVKDEEKWTATCLPTDSTGRYTILKGQRPAFAVTGLSYAAGTSSNEGEVPVRLQDSNFARPLSYRFRIKTLGPAEIVLTQETLFGDEIVDSRDERIPRATGQVSGLLFSDGVISFTAVEGAPNAVMVKTEIPFRADVAPSVGSGIIDMAAVRRQAAARAAAPASD
jgi:hypothetical protein